VVSIALPRHSGVCGTLPLTKTTMSTHSSSGIQFSGTGAGVSGDWFANDKTIFGEFANSLSGVGLTQFGGFVGIEPNLALTTVQNCSGETLLSSEVRPGFRSND